MSGINTQKILELLGTTSKEKLETLRKEESYPVCAEESANEMLNADLFGTSKKGNSAAATESAKKVRIKPTAKKAAEGIEDDVAPTEEVPVEEPVEEKKTPAQEFDYALRAYYESLVEDLGVEDAEKNLRETFETILADLNPEKDQDADEAVAAECIHKEGEATEMIVETGKGKFPESFTFDEKAFGEEYGIDPETITCIHRPEDPDAKVAEAIEISFDYEDSKVALEISVDNTVSETVDAEEVEPQFTAEFQQVENEEGVMEDVLVLNLIEEREGDDTVKSEEDSETKSEGDEKHSDEEGKGSTDEFIEEAGLDLDGFYSDQHGMKKADKSVHEVKANESLAAKIIRARK